MEFKTGNERRRISTSMAAAAFVINRLSLIDATGKSFCVGQSISTPFTLNSVFPIYVAPASCT